MNKYIEEKLAGVIKEFKKELPKSLDSKFFKKKQGSASYNGYKFQIEEMKGEMFVYESTINARIEVNGSDEEAFSLCLEYVKKVANCLEYPVVSVSTMNTWFSKEDWAKDLILKLGWKEEKNAILGFPFMSYYFPIHPNFLELFPFVKRIFGYLERKSITDSLFEYKPVLAENGEIFSWTFEYKGYIGRLSVIREDNKLFIVEQTTDYKKELHIKESIMIVLNKMLEEGLENQGLQLLMKPSFKHLEKRLSEIHAESHEIANKIFDTLLQEKEALEIELFFSQEKISYNSYMREKDVFILSIATRIFVFYTNLPESFSVFSVDEEEQALLKFNELLGVQFMDKQQYAIQIFKKELLKNKKVNI